MPEQDQILTVKIITDKQSADASRRILEDQNKLLAQLLANYKQAQSSAQSFVSQQQQQNNQANAAVQQFGQGAEQAKQSVQELSDTVAEVEVRVDGLRRTGAALQSLGFENLGQVVSQAGAIQQAYRQINSIFGQLQGSVQGLTPDLGEATTGFLGVTGAIGGTVAILGPVLVAVKSFTDFMAAQQKAINDVTDALKKATDQRLAEIDAIRTETAAEVQARTDSNKAKLTELQNELAYQQQFLTQMQNLAATTLNPLEFTAAEEAATAAQNSIDNLNGKINDLTTQINADTNTVLPAVQAREKDTQSQKDALVAIQARSATEQKVQQELTTMTTAQVNARLAAINNEKAAIQAELDQLNALPNKTDDVNKAIDDLNQQMGALNDESSQLGKVVGRTATDIANAMTDLAKVNQQLQDENAKYAQTLQDRQTADDQANQVAALQQQIANAKDEEEEQAHEDKLTSIHQQEANVDVQIATERAEKTAAIDQQFMDTSLKNLQAYQESESRAEQDYGTQRIRKLQDLYNTLLGLAGTRDVAGFIQARQQGMTDISRSDQDENTAEQRRRQDYEKQQQEAEQQREQQLEQLQQSLQQEGDTKKAALDKQYDDEVASWQKRNDKAAQLEKQLSDLQAKFAQQNLADRRRIEDQAHADTVNKLTQQQEQLTQIITGMTTPAVNFFGDIGTSIVNMINTINAAVGQAHAASSSSSGGGGTRQFAGGIDYVPRDMIAMLHEGEGVRRRVDNHASPGESQRAIIIQPGGALVHVAGVGDLVSRSDLNEQTTELVKAVRIAIQGTP